METVIHQQVIIRLLTTHTPEIRTAPEPGQVRLEWKVEGGTGISLHSTVHTGLTGLD